MIVMKFGGTSVQDAKAIERVAHIVQGRLADRPVVVVSAMAKVTDSLLAMGKAAGGGDRKTALKMARALRERHYDTAGELLGTALFTEFHGDLGADFEDLDELLRGIGAVGEITPRTYDYVASFGEVLSSKIVAAIFGAGLNAERIEIWTDVDGMMTTDPRITPEARRIKVISFDEAAELAYFGAKVLHPATVLPAVQQNIPVYVLNSMNPTCEGTKITARAPRCANIFTAIALKTKTPQVETAAPRRLLVHGYLKSIFEAFDQHDVAVDVVSTSEVSVSVTAETNEAIPALAADLAKLADVKYEGRKAIVCLVGENLRDTPGIAAKVFGILEDVKIRMISQGASEINLTFVIEEDDAAEVVRRLHRAFFAEADPEVFA